MKNLFLDTNILIDVLARREPFHREAIQLFEQAVLKKARLLTTAISITKAWYMLDKYGDDKTAHKAISGIIEYVRIIPVSHRAATMAAGSEFRDFEDAVQYFAALEAETVEAIITRNVRDFRHSVIRVCSAGDYVNDG